METFARLLYERRRRRGKLALPSRNNLGPELVEKVVERLVERLSRLQLTCLRTN